MFPIVLGAIAAGAAVYGAYQSYHANKDAEEKSLYLGALQADEILRRESENESILWEKENVKGEMMTVEAAGRHTTDTGIGDILKSRANLMRNIEIYRKEANFKASMARMGAQQSADLYSDRATASIISGVGSVAQTAAAGYALYSKFKAPSSDPSPENPYTEENFAPYNRGGSRLSLGASNNF